MSETDYAQYHSQIQYPPKDQAQSGSHSSKSSCYDPREWAQLCCAIIIFALSLVTLSYVIDLYTDDNDSSTGVNILSNSTPIRFYLTDMTPVQYQGSRSTCWCVLLVFFISLCYELFFFRLKFI